MLLSGRHSKGGRNWEGMFAAERPFEQIAKCYIGFSPDPVLTGVAMIETIKGIQDMGVIACAKHYGMNF